MASFFGLPEMPKDNLSGPERLARMFCKAVLERPALTRADLRDLITEQIAEDRRRWVRERAFSMEQFEPGLAIAVTKDWLVEIEGGFRLSREGRDVAKHSRAGRRTHNRSRL